MALENIDHTKTKATSPRTNGICERFHKTMLPGFFQIAFRKKLYESIEKLQDDVDEVGRTEMRDQLLQPGV